MVELDKFESNQLFDILAEWNVILKHIFNEVGEPDWSDDNDDEPTEDSDLNSEPSPS